MSDRVVVLRTLGLLCVLVLLVAVAGLDLPRAIDALGDPQQIVDTYGADVLVLSLLQLALAALCAWCALCILLLAAGSLRPSTRLSRVTMRLAPQSGQRVLAALLGVGALALTACGSPSGSSASVLPSTVPTYAASSDAFDWPVSSLPSNADTNTGSETSPAAGTDATASAGSADTGDTTSSSAADGSSPAGGTHTVTSGDCLWTIAHAQLGPGASPAEIAYLVDELYHANRHLIGDNPDVLPIGAMLVLSHA